MVSKIDKITKLKKTPTIFRVFTLIFGDDFLFLITANCDRDESCSLYNFHHEHSLLKFKKIEFSLYAYWIMCVNASLIIAYNVNACQTCSFEVSWSLSSLLH